MRKLLSVLLLLINIPVTADQTCNSSITASTPDSQFVVNGQEVIDLVTGLVWQKCSLGQSGRTCTGTAQTHNWAEALQEAKAMRQRTGHNWRLPDINELRSIVEEQCHDPAINLSIFPNTKSSWYWSASPDVKHAHNIYEVHFNSGGAALAGNDYHEYVRLVRTGQ